jgi:hypothetical protein
LVLKTSITIILRPLFLVDEYHIQEPQIKNEKTPTNSNTSNYVQQCC